MTQLNDEDKISKGYVSNTGDTQGKTGSKALIAPQLGAVPPRHQGLLRRGAPPGQPHRPQGLTVCCLTVQEGVSLLFLLLIFI